MIDYPVFDLRLLEVSLQWTTSSVFASSDPFALTEFFVNRLEGAESLHWRSCRPALRKANLTNDMSMPHLVDVVANINVVWSGRLSSPTLMRQGAKLMAILLWLGFPLFVVLTQFRTQVRCILDEWMANFFSTGSRASKFVCSTSCLRSVNI